MKAAKDDKCPYCGFKVEPKDGFCECIRCNCQWKIPEKVTEKA